MTTTNDPTPSTNSVSRRGFLAAGAFLGFSLLSRSAEAAAAAAASPGPSRVLNNSRPDVDYGFVRADNHILTSCLQCNTGCGIRCKIQDGAVTKIDGNPYSPWTMLPHLPFDTPVDDAAPVDGALCPKGQSGLQTAYDPYRLRKVLKRAGKRGENKWVSIPFEQAIAEICDGGKLFATVPGEADRHVEGLKDLVALRDVAVQKAMSADISAIWAEKDAEKKRQLVAAFKTKHAAHLAAMIDPEHPDFGPRNNQIVCAWGRLKGGRGDFYKRFAAALGTNNAHGHTTVCQGSLYFTCMAISQQYQEGKFSGGQKFYFQADTENSQFILFVGANLFEANYGPPNRTVRLTGNLVSGKTKIAVVDPRFSKLASKAWKWLPLKPGTDGALAMAFIRWMLDNNRFDARFLANANRAAATAAGEPSWTNSTWLVEIRNGKPGKHVRAADVTIDGAPLRAAETRPTRDNKTYREPFMVVMVDGVPTALDPNDTVNPVVGDLFVDTTLPDGTRVKTGLQLLRDNANERTVEQWCEIAGVRAADVIAVAREMTSYGKAAAVDMHRGVAQHTNGFYNVLGWMTVNMLLGNFDAKGGSIKGTTFDTMGRGNLFSLNTFPDKPTTFGINSIRYGLDYEKSTLFAGYPAKRNWYPLASDIYEEIIPSIGDAYPYPVKALFLYMGAPTYALPAGHTNIDVLCDTKRLPLFIACDILVGTSSMYADYIFPDLTFLERWEFHGTHSNIPNKVQPVRQPAIAPLTENCTVFGHTVPISFESMMLGIAEKLGLPGFGDHAFGENRHFKHPDDFYLRAVANLAFGEKTDGTGGVREADDRELDVFWNARKHLPTTVFDVQRWKAIVGEPMWRKVVYVLNRGGRYEDHERGYTGDKLTHAYGKLLNLYQEKTADTIHAGTGENLPGLACYVPVADYLGRDPQALRDKHDFALITHRVISQTKSRTIADPWLSALMPENGILINPADAAKHGFKNGQLVKVVSATNPKGEWPLGNGETKPMIGKIVLTQTMRPGVISFALGFGHWATGAADTHVDGHLIKGEARRALGIHANAAMWTDPAVPNTCMFDPVGGSVSFYDTHVSLVPA